MLLHRTPRHWLSRLVPFLARPVLFRRPDRVRPFLECLEERTVPTVLLTPEPANSVGAAAGYLVEFRKGTPGFISGAGANVGAGDNLFAFDQSNVSILADATDNGVATINYVDSGGGNDFVLPRDVGVPPLTLHKPATSVPGGPNSSTFNPVLEDDEFAMVSSGFIFIPSA